MTKFGKLLLILAVIVILVIILFVLQKKAPIVAPVSVSDEEWKEYPLDIIPAEQYPIEFVEGNKNDLDSFSILPNSKVSGKFTIQGIVRGGYYFEANIQINILDSNKKLLKAGYATAMTDWMTAEPVKFQGDIDFTNLPKGPAYIEIHNDNASGLPENDKSILIPIVIE